MANNKEKEQNQKSVWDNFTRKYALSKTLRFELKPNPKTRDWMDKHLKYDKDLQTFLKDQEIEDAYQGLKPFFDKLHEEFITDSLNSKIARRIDFSGYLEDYKAKKDLNKKENDLRKEIGEAFIEAGEEWKKKKYPNYEWKKGSKVANGSDVLLTQDILKLIKDLNPDNQEVKKIIEETFKGFFTYFSGFNQNRKNYYTVKDEKATAVATRIVHENLPKFCDNLIQFECIAKKKKNGEMEKFVRKSEYLNAYQYLKDQGKTTKIKDSESGEMIEAKAISADVIQISYFSSCLSQPGIEEYNRVIGHYNLLINLYNQAKENEEKDLKKSEKTFKRLPIFKMLYKQIGCGERDPLFFSLTHDTKAKAQENKEKYKKPYSVEQILEQAKLAGERYFKRNGNNEALNTVAEFTDYILKKESHGGVYWSKIALNTISNKYFANWHTLKDKLRDAKIFNKGKKGDEEDIKIPEAVELEGFFKVLDDSVKELEDIKNDITWKSEGIFFKKSLIEELKDVEQNKINQQRKEIIQKSAKPSEALLALIFKDIKNYADLFINQADEILKLEKYSSKESIEKIKKWMDNALAINRMLKYFLVKESKAKGEQIDPAISESLRTLLNLEDIPWFKWYDALRNYLTKKPQDDVKENKLKLNFENSTLASGWDINKEFTNSCVILKNTEGKMFLGVMKKEYSSLFQKELLEGRGKKKITRPNPLYKTEDSEVYEKMEYNFWSDVSKMIPKCSTQLKNVIKHFQQSNEDFIFPIGFKVTSSEEFTEECKITKKEFDLNNRVIKKKDITIHEMRYNLSDTQEKQYIKSFQKEYWELLLCQEKNEELSTGDIYIEWKKFCSKRYTEFSDWEKKYKDSLTNWINFCKHFLSKYPKTKLFEYSFKKSEDYKSIDEFYLDVDICSYKLKIDTKVNKTVLDKLVDEGKIYLFEIKNQDSNEGKKEGHRKNLHTIYWKAVFEEVANRPKLNGEAEVFYRKALSQDKLERVKDKKGKEIIKNYRFSKEKFIFHIPITFNFCLQNKNVNNIVNENISSNSKICFLGIDRGEKHLAYYSLVNQKGEIIDQGTLNMPFTDKDGKPRCVKKDKYFYDSKNDKWIPKAVDCWNYNDLLDAMASNRDMARKNWQTIGTIKELKNGYISQVVRRIVDIAIYKNKEAHLFKEAPSFIVLENLNIGFKRGRQKIEKSVYQKLELALAKKLNFVVDKTAQDGEIGSVTNALQLTPPVNNFQDIENKKQFGFMLYARADYTSQTDPITGWRKSIYLKKGSEEYIKEQIVNAFDDIGFDGKDYYFKYTVDYIDPIEKKSKKEYQKSWILFSSIKGKSLDRFRGERDVDKNEWVSTPQDIVKILNAVFEDFDLNRLLLSQIINEGMIPKKIDQNHTGWESLRFAIDLIQQIRNTGVNKEDNDFILSPVRDENGNHFDSRKAKNNEPNSGDANGAYNIARKGLIINEHIKLGLSLFIKDEEWGTWLAGANIWEKWIQKNIDQLINKKVDIV